MMSSFRLEVIHESHAGQARRLVRDTALRLGADDAKAGEAAIIATELATNLVKHGGGGEIILREIKEGAACGLEIHALDRGPGMTSVSACLRDGYSTAGSAGTGLGAVQRLAGQFQIQSQPGKGTAIWLHIPLAAGTGPRGKFEAGGVSVALRGEELCGDSWDVRESSSGGVRALVADGLGHGAFAEEASREAVAVFRQHDATGPSESLRLIHQALFKTRGAAASMVEIKPEAGRLTAAGVGNVAMRVHGGKGSKSITGDNGTLGAAIRKVSDQYHPWESGSLLILHSDGIGSQWNLDDYPGLSRRHPGLIAGVLYRDFRRPHDDATVVVIRHSPS